MSFRFSRSYQGPVNAVIFDWAGTLIDYGSRAPVAAFVEVFRQHGLVVSDQQVRVPMGAHKRDHIRALLNMPEIGDAFAHKNGRVFNDNDVEKIYAAFLPIQLASLAQHSDLIPGALSTIDALKRRGIKIGSTTGYTREIMEAVISQAREEGLVVDSMVCASDVKQSRPAPWMCFENAHRLNIYPMQSIVKVGDTISDIEEGLNAGMWSVGVAKSGNELGLSFSEVGKYGQLDLKLKLEIAYARMYAAGAHYVIDTVADLPDVLQEIDKQMRLGRHP